MKQELQNAKAVPVCPVAVRRSNSDVPLLLRSLTASDGQKYRLITAGDERGPSPSRREHDCRRLGVRRVSGWSSSGHLVQFKPNKKAYINIYKEHGHFWMLFSEGEQGESGPPEGHGAETASEAGAAKWETL